MPASAVSPIVPFETAYVGITRPKSRALSNPTSASWTLSPHSRVLAKKSPEKEKSEEEESKVRPAYNHHADLAAAMSSTLSGLERKTPMGMISIHNSMRGCWDGVIIICLVYIFVMVPLEVAYDNPSSTPWVLLGNTVDLIFWADILVCFRTTYLHENGQEEWNPTTIAVHYLKDFFFIDFFCCIAGFPMSMVIEKLVIAVAGSGRGADTSVTKLAKAPRVLKVVRSLKIMKVFRVLKIARFLDEIKDSMPGLAVFIRLMRLLLTTAFFLHINACFFSIVGRGEEEIHNSWMYTIGLYGDDETWLSEYLNALYWSATTSTTVGYGDLLPVNEAEKTYCIISMCIGVGLYGYIIGSMTEVVTSTGFVENQVNQQMDQVHEFIKRHKLPRRLSRTILHFFRHHYGRKRLGDERKILELLPHRLLKDVHRLIREDTQVPLFMMMDAKHFASAMDLLYPRTVAAGGTIIVGSHKDSEPEDEFFVLLEGIVEICSFTKEEANRGLKTHETRIIENTPAIKRLFEEFGIDEAGMKYDELKKVLDTLTGHPVNDKMVKLTMQTIDDDGNGFIELEEFVEWYVAEKIEGPHGYGYTQKVLTPVCTFGTYTAFGLGPSCCTYLARNECEIYAVSTEALMHEFGDNSEVLDLIDYCLVRPAQKYGPHIDIDGPSEEEKEAYINEYKAGIKKKRKDAPEWQSKSVLQRRWSTRCMPTSKVAPTPPGIGGREYRESPSQPKGSKSRNRMMDSGSMARQFQGINKKLDWTQENLQLLKHKIEKSDVRMEQMHRDNQQTMKRLIESNVATLFGKARVTL